MSYSTMLPCLLTPKELLNERKRVNTWFVHRRDKGKPTDIVYRRLKALEAELGRRRIYW
jgi:hypothetical protein